MSTLRIWCERWLALALCLLASPAHAQLTLPEAVARALDNNPFLQVFPLREQAAAARTDTAKRDPGYAIGIEAENLAGNGTLSGTDNAEYALSISSVIELGDKRKARTALANTRYARTALEHKAAALDLVATVTQGFVSALSLKHQILVEERALALTDETLDVISRLARKGAVPEADRLRAKAQQSQAELNLAALKAEYDAEKQSLASLWGEPQAGFNDVEGNLFSFANATDFPSLRRRVERSPELAILASERRMAEAELALARSQSSANINWRLGVRHEQFSSDSALTASLEIPLFSAARNRGEEKAAHAELNSQSYRREDRELKLGARLYRAWQAFQQNQLAAKTLQTRIIPTLESAQSQTRLAYEQGRYRYTDWLAVQNELLDARRRLIHAATAALHNQTLIEQLTATPLAEEASHDD